MDIFTRRSNVKWTFSQGGRKDICHQVALEDRFGQYLKPVSLEIRTRIPNIIIIIIINSNNEDNN